MRFKRRAIKEQFKPLDMYFEEQSRKFNTGDIDLVDKAERYMEEALSGNKAEEAKKLRISSPVQRLIKFVEWAKRRGGDAMNQITKKPESEMTREELEMRKPFWTRTYFFGEKEFRFDKKFINQYMESADTLVKDNESAYYDYKKRSLFPKLTDTS